MNNMLKVKCIFLVGCIFFISCVFKNKQVNKNLAFKKYNDTTCFVKNICECKQGSNHKYQEIEHIELKNLTYIQFLKDLQSCGYKILYFNAFWGNCDVFKDDERHIFIQKVEKYKIFFYKLSNNQGHYVYLHIHDKLKHLKSSIKCEKKFNMEMDSFYMYDFPSYYYEEKSYDEIDSLGSGLK
jgi:hypothetical protein